MKNKSLLIIVSVSLMLFVGLLFSVYKIVTKDAEVFYADGYVSISDAESSEKIYFKEGTTYKRGYGKEVIFKDKENVKREAGKYNFVFYNNKSINFLNDGVLLDLDKVNESFVPYYNIKSNYLIEYTANKYVIDGKKEDVIVDNFIGRINDQKYIVAGNNLRLKLSSSEEYVESYYFELNFIDGQTVKIDNDKINVETISEECYILVGDSIKIDLSNQVIFYQDEARVNLDEIVINHNENIDILYEEPDLEVNPGGSGGGTGTGNGDGTGDGSGSGDGSGGAGGAGGSGGSGTGEGEDSDTETPGNGETPDVGGSDVELNPPVEDPEYEVETIIEYKNIPYVEFLSSSTNSHKLTMRFKVIDIHNLISGPVKVQYMDLQTGDVYVEEYVNYSDTIEFIADGLRSNTNYIVTISASYIRNNNVYNDYTMFQRTFSTKDLGVTLEKDYVTSSEIAFNVNLSENATFTSGELNLYDNLGELVETYKFDNDATTFNVLFSTLKSNTKYTARIENLEYGNVVYTSGSAVAYVLTTLKYNPFKDGSVETSPIATVHKKDFVFKFDMGEINDPDKAIKGYEYHIYNKETGEVVKKIEKEDNKPFEIEIDNETILKNTTYYYKVVVTLNDNEKVIDYETLPSNDFNMDTKMSPTMRFTTTGVTAKTLNGYFVITDADNTIDTEKSIYVEYSNSLGETGTKVLEYATCPTNEAETTKCAYLELVDLTSDEVYTISLLAYVDLNDPSVVPGFAQIGALKLMTEQADVILTDMTSSSLDMDLSEALVDIFKLNIKFSIDELTDEAVKNNMTSFDIMLYEGADATGLYLGNYHVGAGVNIVEEYFDNTKVITIKDFKLSLETLQAIHVNDGGQISQKYSIKLANGRSGTDFVEFKPYTLTFEINPELLGLTSNDATINVTPIKNSEYKNESMLNGDTIVGLKVNPNFGNKKYATSIDFTIYDVTNPSGIKSVKYSEKLQLDDSSIIPEFNFYFDETDKSYSGFLRRGRIYQFEYTINLDLNNDGVTDIVYPTSPESIGKAEPVKSDQIEVLKQKPSMVLFPWISDTSSVVYKYEVTDVDNALPENYEIYYEVGEAKYTSTTVNCEKASSAAASSFACKKVEGLNPKDIYNIYLEPVLLEKEGTEVTKVDINNFTFEGIYNLDNLVYNLETTDVLTSKYNNMISLKLSEPYDLLADEDKLSEMALRNRIAYYTVTLTVNGTDKQVFINRITTKERANTSNIVTYKEGGKDVYTWYSDEKSTNLGKVAYVAACENEEGTCIYVDYSQLYNSSFGQSFFKNNFVDKDIVVTLSAAYDTGKIKYLGDANTQYLFQVQSNQNIEFNGSLLNNTYMIVNSKRMADTKFSYSALGGVYTYKYSEGGFVDDGVNQNGEDKIYFVNIIDTVKFNSKNMDQNKSALSDVGYSISYRGIEIPFALSNGSVTLPIVAKELGMQDITGTGLFKFNKVVPSITVTNTLNNTILNGIKVGLGLSGYQEDDLTSKEVTIKVFKSETGNLVKTIKVHKDKLLSTNVEKDENGRFIVTNPNEYKVDVTSVYLDGSKEGLDPSLYSYNYKTGELKFSDEVEINDATTIKVNYLIIIDGLNSGESYYLEAFMEVKGTDTSLVETTSNTFEQFKYEFTTKVAEEVKVTGTKLDTVSETTEERYDKRWLTTNYNIDDIVGIDSFIYEICNDDNSLCVKDTNRLLDATYYVDGGTYFSKTNGYDALIYHDISIEDGYDFIFNTDYNVKISAVVIEENDVNSTYEIFNSKLHLRPLVKPTITVIKNTGFENGNNPYLTFDISFEDPDKVISNFDEVYEKGEYEIYLATANMNEISGTRMECDKSNSICSAKYTEVALNTRYNLVVEYKTYTNNLGEEAQSSFSPSYLIYTLAGNGVAVGTTQYIALANTTILRFGYATNLVQDFVLDENENLIPDPDQEAYVAGIVYTIVKQNGGSKVNGTMMFTGDNKIEHVMDATADLGESYYQITIPGTPYVGGPGFTIYYQFYLGGNIAKDLNNEGACLDNNIANVWENGSCYILDDTQYEEDTIYEGGK